MSIRGLNVNSVNSDYLSTYHYLFSIVALSVLLNYRLHTPRTWQAASLAVATNLSPNSSRTGHRCAPTTSTSQPRSPPERSGWRRRCVKTWRGGKRSRGPSATGKALRRPHKWREKIQRAKMILGRRRPALLPSTLNSRYFSDLPPIKPSPFADARRQKLKPRCLCFGVPPSRGHAFPEALSLSCFLSGSFACMAPP